MLYSGIFDLILNVEQFNSRKKSFMLFLSVRFRDSREIVEWLSWPMIIIWTSGHHPERIRGITRPRYLKMLERRIYSEPKQDHTFVHRSFEMAKIHEIEEGWRRRLFSSGQTVDFWFRHWKPGGFVILVAVDTRANR